MEKEAGGKPRGSERSGAGMVLPWRWALAYLLLLAAVVAAGALFSGHLRRDAKRHAQNELSAIADLKASQIRRWLDERLGDAGAAVESPFFSARARDFLAGREGGALREQLLAWMRARMDNYGYMSLFLLDAQGEAALSLNPRGEPLGDHARLFALESMAKGEVTHSDLHRAEGGGHVHMDLVAPIPGPEKGGAYAAGAVLFRIDPRDFLYPFVQSWPTPSATAETLLVRREGDEVVFLNELRHREGTALELRLPLGDEDLPAARAARGEVGIVEGTDYRGVKVLADLRSVPGTGWFMVAKVDASEVYSPVALPAWLSVSLAALLVLALGLSFALAWSRRQGRFYRRQSELEAELRRSEELYRLLFLHTPIGVFYYGPDLVITDCNERFVEILRSSRERLIGLDMNALRDRSVLPSIRAALAGVEGRYEGPYNATTSDAHIYISMRTTPLRDREGAVIGGVGIVEDTSARHDMEEELRRSEERYRQLFYGSPLAVFQYDHDLVVTDCNDRAAETTRYGRESLIGMDLNELQDRSMLPTLRDALGGKYGHYEGFYRSTTTGRELWVCLHAAPLVGPGGEIAGGIAVVEDMSDRRLLERQLAEREFFLRRLTDNMLDLISQCDVNGNFTYLSPSNRRVLGYREEELLGRNVLELVHPEDLPTVAEAYAESTRELVPGKVEFRARKADDTYVWVESVGNPLFDEEGELIGAIFVTRDISERRRVEEKLRMNEEKFRELFENMKSGVAICEARAGGEDFVITGFNRAAERVERIDRSEVIGRSVTEVFPGVKEFGLFEVFQRVWRTGRPESFPAALFRDQRLEGWRENFVTKLPSGEVVAIYDDVTERKLEERRLERLNRCFLELGTDPLGNIRMIVDAGQEILDADAMHYSRAGGGELTIYHTATESGGFEPLEMADHPLCRGIIAENRDQPVAIEDLQAHACGKVPYRAGVGGFSSYLAYPVRAHGMTVGVLGMLRREKGGFGSEERDFMGLLARAIAVEEERLAHEEELRDFIDIASHELRHPMTIIKGYSSMLLAYQDRMDETARRETLTDIKKGVDRLEKLVSQLLETARIERRKLRLTVAEADLERVAVTAVEEMRERSPGRAIALRTSGKPRAVRADPERVGQVMVILLENAVHYSPPQSPIEVELSFGEGGGATVSVLDRGWGVPEEYEERIFERFFQVGDPLHHSTCGIGLGLHIAREIVQAHGGRIWHEPREGGGSIFRFTI